MSSSFRLWCAAVVAICLLPAAAHADWNQANDEANRQRMMAEMRANARANDRANEESQRRQQAAYDARQRSSSNSGGGSSSSASTGASYAPYQAAPEGPHSVVATYSFTIHKQESESQTVARIEREARSGQMQSQFNLGRIYYTGYGVGRSDAKAREWFGAAADQGHPAAETQYGLMLFHGQGGASDRERGLSYLKKAAEHGDIHGQAVYGALALKPLIDPQPELVGYLVKAADAGDLVAQNALGRVVYYLGAGAPYDDVKALKYLRMAAEQHDPSSMNDLGERYLSGEGVLKDEARGLSLLKASADAGFPDAQAQYGFMQVKGLYGVHQDTTAGASALRTADQSGSPLAAFYLGTMNEFGTGMPKDPVTADAFYKRAADGGNRDAKARYGLNLVRGLGVAQDIAKGTQLIQASADVGSDLGEEFLARLYFDGVGVPKDRQKSAQWFRKAAAHGNEAAAHALQTEPDFK